MRKRARASSINTNFMQHQSVLDPLSGKVPVGRTSSNVKNVVRRYLVYVHCLSIPAIPLLKKSGIKKAWTQVHLDIYTMARQMNGCNWAGIENEREAGSKRQSK